MSDSEFARGMRNLFEHGNRAWNEGDIEGAYRTLPDDVEYHLAAAWPEARSLRGRAQVVRFFEDFRETFPDARAGPLEFEEISERRVIVGFPVVGTGRASGVRIDMEIWQTWDLSEQGLPERVREYLSRGAALEAAR